MATETRRPRAKFDPSAFESFRFLARELDDRGRVTLRYALDEEIEFVEVFELPLGDPDRRLDEAERQRVEGLLALLHWVAGVSYYKTAAARRRSAARPAPRRPRRPRCSRRSTPRASASSPTPTSCRRCRDPRFAAGRRPRGR